MPVAASFTRASYFSASICPAEAAGMALHSTRIPSGMPETPNARAASSTSSGMASSFTTVTIHSLALSNWRGRRVSMRAPNSSMESGVFSAPSWFTAERMGVGRRMLKRKRMVPSTAQMKPGLSMPLSEPM